MTLKFINLTMSLSGREDNADEPQSCTNAERIVSELQDVTTEPQRKRARSNFWSYCKKNVSEDGESMARCNSCSVSCMNQKGTSNL